MARTSKTKIGGGEGEQSDRMIRAAASGAEARSQAHGQLLNQYRAGADQANQTAQIAGQVIGQGEDRAQQASQFDRSMRQRESETDLDAAKAGFERGGQEPQDSRAAKLEAEMQKGEGQPKIGALDSESQDRLKSQTEQGLEMDSHGRWRPTAERKSMQERTQRREDFQADTERIRAMAYKDQIGLQAQKAYAAGDMEGYDEKAKESASYANSSQKLYDRIKNGEINDEDWSAIEKTAKGSEDADPSLMEAIKGRDSGDRLLAHLRSRIQHDAITSIMRTGGAEEFLKIDWTMPKMREFIDTRNAINDFNRANPALSQTAMIRNTQDKMRFVNMTAAWQVYMGMGVTPSPSGGMAPATAAPGQEGGQPGAQEQLVPPGGTQVPGREAGTNAVRDARSGGASPGQSLQVGQNQDPTAQHGTWQDEGYSSPTRQRVAQRYPR